MSKDPAFLFYHQDFFTGVSDMTNEEIGAYIKCMCVQASKGGITEKHMLIICNSSDIHNVIKTKFILNTDTNLLENTRLKLEIDRRKKYSESRSNNRKKDKTTITKDAIICKTYVNHMENERENENEDVIEVKKGIEAGVKIQKPKIDLQAIVDNYNSICVNIPKAETLGEKRKTAIRNILNTHSLQQITDVFNKAAESDFLNGRVTNFSASLDWILKPDNFIKILENNYKNNNGKPTANTTGTFTKNR